MNLYLKEEEMGEEAALSLKKRSSKKRKLKFISPNKSSPLKKKDEKTNDLK